MPRTLNLLALSAIALTARFAVADEPSDDQMGANQFSAVVNSDNVYVRSYAGENEYPVAKLNRGDGLVVVGSKGDWLKVLPPTGVNCLVGKAWVEARSNGMARVREDAASTPNVRISSLLSGNYGRVVVTLKPGQDVKVVGQQEEYFQIQPPPGAFAYVNKRFVDPVKKVEVIADRGTLRVKNAGEDRTVDKPIPPITPDMVKPTPPTVVDSTTKPSNGDVAIAPTTKSSDTDTASLDAMEAKLTAAGKLPLTQQPIDDLLAGYRSLASDANQPEATRKGAEMRVKLLEVRQDALKTIVAANEDRQKRAAEQMPLDAEAKEIGQRIAAAQFKVYAAVGTVRTSSLASNGRSLYRLTDPATGRTVIYLDDADGHAAGLEGQFVGVKGAVADDNVKRIKLVRPQAIEAVDPNELKTGAVRSGLIPASLTETADAGR